MKQILWSIQKWLSDVVGKREYHRYLEKKDRGRRLTAQFLTFITMIAGLDDPAGTGSTLIGICGTTLPSSLLPKVSAFFCFVFSR